MKVKAVFFDLDGTLLPMDQESFIKAYLDGLVKLLSPKGYDPKSVADALWGSTRAMIKNDGSKTNEQVFWDSLCEILGSNVKNEEDALSEFYEIEFQKIQQVCGYTPLSRNLLDILHRANIPVVLATSPLFPKIATESRIRWAGLKNDDFIHITTFENSSYCKPNPIYYTTLLHKLDLNPHECVMIGNDVGDDMVAAEIGMNVFLLTDCLINRKNEDITKYRHGDFNELYKYIEELINV